VPQRCNVALGSAIWKYWTKYTITVDAIALGVYDRFSELNENPVVVVKNNNKKRGINEETCNFFDNPCNYVAIPIVELNPFWLYDVKNTMTNVKKNKKSDFQSMMVSSVVPLYHIFL
jgi:hypothetical protein